MAEQQINSQIQTNNEELTNTITLHDIIRMVIANKYKAQTGEISQNRNFYLSLVGTAISVATLIVTLTK